MLFEKLADNLTKVIKKLDQEKLADKVIDVILYEITEKIFDEMKNKEITFSDYFRRFDTENKR